MTTGHGPTSARALIALIAVTTTVMTSNPANAASSLNTKAHAVTAGTTGGVSTSSAFDVTTMDGTSLHATNTATATATCNNCRSIALTIQVALVTPERRLTATNSATARSSCQTGCQTLSAAYQYVVVSPQPLELTGPGRARLDQLKHDLDALRRSGKDLPTIRTSADTIANQVNTVLTTMLQTQDHHGKGRGWINSNRDLKHTSST